MKIVEVTPYEPPSSGWVSRVKLLRDIIEARGGRCEILDIGPSRKIERSDCISVYGGRDFLAKLWRYSRRRYTFHTHINGQYFRGLLLALATVVVGRLHRNRCVTTFHAGNNQPNLTGWKGIYLTPFFSAIFLLSQAVVCNSESVRRMLIKRFTTENKVHAIPAFSKQYLEYRTVDLPESLEKFILAHKRLLSTYICFRPGFYYDVVNAAIAKISRDAIDVGLIVVGTGPEKKEFCAQLKNLGIDQKVYLTGDLDHDSFMTLLARSDLHLRTAMSDGVSSTVLEALSLGVPVLAADNGTRPESVILYAADDAVDLANKLRHLLRNPIELAASVIRPTITDTGKTEVDLLFGPDV